MRHDRFLAQVDDQGQLTLIENVGDDQIVIYLPALPARVLANLLRRQAVRNTSRARP